MKTVHINCGPEPPDTNGDQPMLGSVHAPVPNGPGNVTEHGLSIDEDGPGPTGRRLAWDSVLTEALDDQTEAMASVLRRAPVLLSALGVHIDIVRTKDGCVIVRSRPTAGARGSDACQLTKGFLEELPLAVFGVSGTILENTCVRRGGDTCLFTLLWDVQSTPVPTLVQPTPDEPSELDEQPFYDGQLDDHLNLDDQPVEDLHLDDLSVETTEPTAPAHDVTEVSDHLPVVSSIGAHDLPTAGPPPNDSASVVPDRSRRRYRTLSRRRSRRLVPPWFKRRSWLLVLAMLAGAVGGHWAAGHKQVTYKAQATLVVQSGASLLGPGGAAEAETLAVTYATVIPTDSGVLKLAAHRLGVPEVTVSDRLSVTVDTGTAVLVLAYTAPTSSEAIAGATALAQVVGSGESSSNAIPSGSISVVQLPTGAAASHSLQKYGLPIGAIAGLLLGFILVIAVERTDPRIDSATELGALTECRAAAVPDDLSFPELTRAIALAIFPEHSLTVVPLLASDTEVSAMLAKQMQAAWPADAPETKVDIGSSFEADPAARGRENMPTVLVVKAGETSRRVSSAVERLQAMQRAPVWSVLVTRRGRRELRARGH